MRIISGSYRGKKLHTPTQKEIRPTTDRAKEALFNILGERLNADCVFVDAFCGSGAVGIEALSRGAKKVYFIDNKKEAISLLESNLIGIKGDYEILKQDIFSAIKSLNQKEISIDIFFADPPYCQDFTKNILRELFDNKVKIVVIEKENNKAKTPKIKSKELLSEKREKDFICYDTRAYASTRFDFYKKETRCAITGTFDPITNGHLDLIMKAKELFDKVVVVLLINENKSVRYSLEERKEMVKLATKNIGDNIVVDSYDGLAIDYCNKNNIQYIIRGARNSKDMLYEYNMAEYNHKQGGIDTIVLWAKSQISSSKIKEKLDNGESIGEYVSAEVMEKLSKQ